MSTPGLTDRHRDYAVMIVEDNKDFAENLAEIISQLGPIPTVCLDIKSARHELKSISPDICFIDLRLPDGNGEDLVTEVANDHPQTLTIVLTANASIQSAISVVNAGAFGFLLKDMPVNGILTCFIRACERIDLEREKTELQSKLRHQEQLALIGQMSATLAHEIRNPLTGISQALELLLESVGEPPEMKGLKDSILKRFRAMNHLVEDLLEFSKPLNVKKTEVEFGSLLSVVESEMRSEGALDDIVVNKSANIAGTTAKIDEVHFRILIRNLLRNAEQAMQESETKMVTIDTEQAGSRLLLRFSDTGSGVPSSLENRVFEPFFTTKTRGTGLGLALASRIVGEHAGEISVVNLPGSGAQFTISIDNKN
ncbi:MAG: two-component system sensor histidine kinase/response regulator [Planctomycetota bacterium]